MKATDGYTESNHTTTKIDDKETKWEIDEIFQLNNFGLKRDTIYSLRVHMMYENDGDHRASMLKCLYLYYLWLLLFELNAPLTWLNGHHSVSAVVVIVNCQNDRKEWVKIHFDLLYADLCDLIFNSWIQWFLFFSKKNCFIFSFFLLFSSFVTSSGCSTFTMSL